MTRSGRARRARRSFTLAEMLVYLALVTGALVAIGGLSLSAQRTLRLQQSLIDINVDATRYLSALRRDVEAARTLHVEPARLELLRADGRRVVYIVGRRLESAGAGAGGALHFPTMRGLSVAAVGSGVRVRIDLTAPGADGGEVRRTFEGAAAPRARGAR